MANTLRTKPAPKPEEPQKPQKPQKARTKNADNNIVLRWLRKFISGDYLFSNNVWRSPLWFVLYIVVLILILVGIRLVPVRKYNEINILRSELKEISVKSHQTKAKISLITSPEALLKDFTGGNETAKFSDYIDDPVIIKVIKSNGKGK